MKPEAAYLLAAVRGATLPATSALDWEALLALADSHGLLPLLCQARGSDLPPEFAIRLRERRARSLFLTGELEALLSHFAKHSLDILALKGPVLSDLLYHQVSLRSSGDLDLLVRPSDFSRAESLLIELGFAPASDADDYHREFERDGSFVELHFETSSPSAPRFDAAGAWERSQSLEFRGCPVQFLAPMDLVLYLALHGLKHRFARLIWVLDVANSLAILDECDQSALLDHATALNLRNILLFSCEVARHSLSCSLPASIAEAIAAQPSLARRAQEMAEAILSSVADPTGFIDDPGFYLLLADHPASRWKQRLSFFSPTQRDRRLAERYGISRKYAPLLRPFRILRRHGATPVLRTLFPRSGNNLPSS